MAKNQAPRKPVAPRFDAGHVPITEELDSAERTLPPVAPVAIALVAVALVLGILMYVLRAKPVAQGGIDAVFFSQPENMPNAMVLLLVTLHNVGGKTLYIKNITANVKTGENDYPDSAASAGDYDRYFMAYPDLKAAATAPLVVETKIAPGAEQKGSVLVSFPINKEQFDARKDLTVTIEPYDQGPIVLREKSAQTK